MLILTNMHWMFLIHYQGKVNMSSVICRGKDLRISDDHFNLQQQERELKDIVIHDLRRTFGSNCVMAGISLPAVQAWMGHSSIETTIKHYGHLTQSYRKEEIKKIEGRMDTCMDTEKNKRGHESHNPLIFMVPPARIELATPGLGNLCSILLS